MRSITLFIAITLISFAADIQAQDQPFNGISIAWDGDYSEWVLLDGDGNINGSIKTRWVTIDSWTEWKWSLNAMEGDIRKKFLEQKIWEVTGPGGIVTMQPLYGDDPKAWRLTNNDISFIFETKWGNRADEWITRGEDNGVFYIYTAFENDPRDWGIIDDLYEDVPLEFRIAMTFLATYLTSPKTR